MPDMIRDGSGNGYLAKVNTLQRLYVDAISTDEQNDATERGDSYNINTGVITLTNTADTPVLYLKNNQDQDFHIRSIAVGVGPTTGGASSYIKVTIVKNPTTGTIVSNATSADINSNRSFSSAKTATIDVYKGATGNTMTDGTDQAIIFAYANARLFATIDEFLAKGNSIGVKIQAPSGNTSMDCYVALVTHYEATGE